MSGGVVLVVDLDPRAASTIVGWVGPLGLRVLGVADLAAAGEALDGGQVELMLLDIDQQRSGWRRFVVHEAVRSALCPVIVVTDEPSVDTAVAALRAGALDYLVRPLERRTLLAAVDRARERTRLLGELRTVRRALQGLRTWTVEAEEILGRPGAAGLLAHTSAAAGAAGGPRDPLAALPAEEQALLTEREAEVTRLLAEGLRVADIAGRLFLSPHTVRNHLKSVFRKLGVHSQVELLSRLQSAD